jgi:membrane fusion protein, heavy metal efflux system
MIRSAWLLVCGPILVLACKRTEPTLASSLPSASASSSSSAHSDEEDHKELVRRVHLTPKVIADVKIATEEVTLQVLAASVSLPGEIAADPDKSARVSSPVAGRILEVRFKEGSRVKKGDVVAVIRVPELAKVRAAYTGVSARAVTAKSNAQRLAELSDKGLAPTFEATAAKTEAQALAAEAQALGEQINALGAGGGADLMLRAPVAGVVITRDAVVGQPVAVDHTLASIADLSELWFMGRVFEKDLQHIKTGAKADVVLNAFPKEHFEGVVEYIGRQIDPIARTMTARIRLINRSDLLSLGLFGNVRISSADQKLAPAPVLTVPRAAITEVAGKPCVFVRHADDDFELHDLVLGEESVGRVGVVSGLREHELVVTRGLFTLKSLVLKSALEEEP